MIALVHVPAFSLSPVVDLVGMAVTLGAAVLVAHWGAFRPQAKRVIAAILIAFALVVVVAPVVFASDEDDFVMWTRCKQLTSSDAEYWLYSCWAR